MAFGLEQSFRELLDALPAAIYTTDTAGRITFYNEAAAELWGRDRTFKTANGVAHGFVLAGWDAHAARAVPDG